MRISQAATKGPVRALIALAALGLWSSVAAAGLLGTTSRAINGGGPDGGYWRGSVDVYALKDVVPGFPQFGTNEVEATFDWAVFAPCQFQLFLDDCGIAATDPAPGQVVYAYQVLEVTIARPGIGSVTVGIDSTDVVTTLPMQVLTSWAGEQAITSAYLAANTSAVWSFVDANPGDAELIGVGEISPLLVFASPNAPQLDTFTVSSGVAIYNGSDVGSPGSEPFIPEPGSVVLLLIGVAGLFLSRRSVR